MIIFYVSINKIKHIEKHCVCQINGAISELEKVLNKVLGVEEEDSQTQPSDASSPTPEQDSSQQPQQQKSPEELLINGILNQIFK